MTQQAREDVERLLKELRETLLFAGVPKQQLNVCKGPNYTVQHFAKAFDWLHQFSLCSQFIEMKKVYALRTPQQWEMYTHIGLEGTQEQILQGSASKALLKRWRLRRPRMFSKDKPHD